MIDRHTNPLSCAICGHDWAIATDWSNGDPLWAWVTADTNDYDHRVVEWCGLVCAGNCTYANLDRFGRKDYLDAHLSWFVGEDRAIRITCRLLDDYVWTEDHRSALLRFAMRAAHMSMDERRAPRRGARQNPALHPCPVKGCGSRCECRRRTANGQLTNRDHLDASATDGARNGDAF